MPVHPDPPFIDSVAAQAFRAKVRAIYNAPSAVPKEVFNVQEPLPPVPYFDVPEGPSIIAQPAAKPAIPRTAPPPIPTTAPTTPIPTTNPVPRFAPPPGSGGAAVITTTAGGVITGAGLLTGGLTLVAGALILHDAHELYKLWKLSQPEPKPTPKSLPFTGGQEDGVVYNVKAIATYIRKSENDEAGNYALFGLATGPFDSVEPIINTWIGGLQEYPGAWVLRKPRFAGDSERAGVLGYVEDPNNQGPGVGFHENGVIVALRVVRVWRRDNQPDTAAATAKVPTRSPSPLARSSPAAAPTARPGNTPFGQAPPAPVAAPLATNNRVPITITTPGANPITITTPGAAPVTITPTGSPATIKITRPSSSPFLSPTPGSTPRTTPVTTPTGDPVATPAGVPIAVSSPGAKPTNLVMPGGNPITINYPGQAPIVIDPVGFKTPSGVQAAPIAKPGAFVTTPVSPIQTPTNPVITPTKPGTPSTPTIPGVKEPDLESIGLKLVALTALIQGVNKNTTPNAIANAVAPTIAPAVCSTTAPGGCSSNAMNRAVNQGNQDLLNKLGVPAGQAADLLLLGKIDNKLGAQIPGGIGGFLQKFARSIHLDKVINALTLITTLHNAAMLSRNLGSTLGEVTSQALSVIGIKDENDSPIDINKIIGQQVNELFEKALGTDTWKGIKTTWNKANAIIASTTQIMSTVRSLWDSSREILEWTAENTGKIGNALKRFRVVGENAYGYMPEQITHTNAWALKVQKFREGTDSLDDAASSLSGVLGQVQSIQEEAKELKQQKDTFDKNLKELTPKTREDNKPIADAAAASKAASAAPVDAANTFRGEGETPNAGT